MEVRTQAAGISVLCNLLLVGLKLAVGIMIASVSVISEAIHSGLDLLAALIALFSVRTSSRPPDERHQYGHGKIENVSGTVEAILILVAAIWIMAEAWEKIVNKAPVEAVGWGLAVMGVSSAVNLVLALYLLQVARKTHSIALEADALHHLTDVYTSVGVFVGLGVIHFTGWNIVDPLAAIGVALLIIKTAFDLTRRAFMPLIDEALPAEEEEKIRNVLDGYQEKGELAGYHKLRTRQAGADRYVDVHVVLPGNYDLSTAHALSDRIEASIHDCLENTSVVIHMEPCCNQQERNCDSCQEMAKR